MKKKGMHWVLAIICAYIAASASQYALTLWLPRIGTWAYTLTQPIYVAIWTVLTARRYLKSPTWLFYTRWWITLIGPIIGACGAFGTALMDALVYTSSPKLLPLYSVFAMAAVSFCISKPIQTAITSRVEQKLIDEAYEAEHAADIGSKAEEE